LVNNYLSSTFQNSNVIPEVSIETTEISIEHREMIDRIGEIFPDFSSESI